MTTLSRSTDHKVTIVIVNYRTPDETLSCLGSILEDRGADGRLEVVVVDGGSGDRSAETLERSLSTNDFREWVSVLPLSINGGFGWANNQAMLRELQRPDPPDFIHLLNPDARVMPGAIGALLDHMVAHPNCGAAGSRIVDEAGKTQVSSFTFPSLVSEFFRGANTSGLGRRFSAAGRDDTLPVETDWVTGASVMLRAEALRETGLFDDGFFLYFEEVEMLFRMRKAGWSVWHEPRSLVMHAGGVATKIRSGSGERRPFYWYESKRRLYHLLFGSGGALLVIGAWCLGRLMWRVRTFLKPALLQREVISEARDMLQAWNERDEFDSRSFAIDWRAPPGRAPAWMRRAGPNED